MLFRSWRSRALGRHRIADRDLQLNGIDPQAYLTNVVTRIVNGHPNSRIDELLPWAYAANQTLKDVA